MLFAKYFIIKGYELQIEDLLEIIQVYLTLFNIANLN